MSRHVARIFIAATRKLPPLPLRSSAFICGSLVLAFAFNAQAGVTVTDAWVRGTVPAQHTTGAFATITSTEDAKLVGASTPVAKEVQVHLSETKGGMMHMHAVESIALPAGKPVKLQPGGYHVMLMQLTGQIKAGQKVPLTFVVEDAKGKRENVEVEATVRPLGQ